MIKQLDDKGQRHHILLFNRAIVVAFQGFGDDRVDFALR